MLCECLQFNNQHSEMISKTEFCPMQLRILNQIVSQISSTQKFQYKKISDLFNQRCTENIGKYKPKSVKAIQLKIKQICRIEKHYWSYQMDQIMLNSVAKGEKWKDIVKAHQFSENKVTANQVKRKFQCGIRFKFLCLYREIYGNKKPPKVGDIIFKSLLQQDKIMGYFSRGSIDQAERECLLGKSRLILGNIIVFKTSIEDKQEKIEIRSTRAKNRVMNLVNQSFSLKLLVDAIIKLSNQKQYKKLDIVQQLFIENENSRCFRQVQSTPQNFDEPPVDDIQNQDDGKIEQIEQYITFKDLDDEFLVVQDKVSQFGFAQLQADMEL